MQWKQLGLHNRVLTSLQMPAHRMLATLTYQTRISQPTPPLSSHSLLVHVWKYPSNWPTKNDWDSQVLILLLHCRVPCMYCTHRRMVTGYGTYCEEVGNV